MTMSRQYEHECVSPLYALEQKTVVVSCVVTVIRGGKGLGAVLLLLLGTWVPCC